MVIGTNPLTSVPIPKSKPAIFTPAYLHWLDELAELEDVVVVVSVVAAVVPVPGRH